MDKELDRSIPFAYFPRLMQKAQGKCCENQPLSRNRKSRNTAFLPEPETRLRVRGRKAE